MQFFNWKQSKRGGEKRKKKNNKHNKKGSKKMVYEADNHWTQGADGSWQSKAYGGGNSTYVGKTCTHPPKTGCKVGDFTLFPTQDKYVTATMLEDFDVACPLTEFGGGGNDYNQFCGLLMWIPIKDMQAPDYMRLRANAQRIVELMQAGNTIALWCIGSHGRTGLVLATCIGIAEPDIEDPIETVRERHCKHAIETQAQIEVVFKALGRKLPEKYKVKVEPRKVQSYISDGYAWKDPSTPSKIVGGSYTKCIYCQTYGSYNDPVHWYGQKPAHATCYNNDQERQRKLAEEEKTNPGVVDVTKEPENAVRGVGGELIVPDKDPSVVTDEELYNAIKQERPFIAKWSKTYQDQVNNPLIINRRDVFGDLICEICSRLVINPAESEIVVVGDKQLLTHADCSKWEKDLDAEVVCSHCLIYEAQDDGYCSTACSAMGAFNKAQQQNNKENNRPICED